MEFISSDTNVWVDFRVISRIELPFRLLCREDCKGLCPVCGANLNEMTCNCNTKQIDPRLEKLKMLLDS